MSWSFVPLFHSMHLSHARCSPLPQRQVLHHAASYAQRRPYVTSRQILRGLDLEGGECAYVSARIIVIIIVIIIIVIIINIVIIIIVIIIIIIIFIIMNITSPSTNPESASRTSAKSRLLHPLQFGLWALRFVVWGLMFGLWS
jgi:hypothetical protein